MRIDYEKFAIYFDDTEPTLYWWEDMRAREVRDLLIEVYQKGFKAGQAKQSGNDENNS